MLKAPLPMDERTGTLDTRVLGLDPAAEKRLTAYSDRIERALAPGKVLRDLSATASKSAEQAARIAGVLALARDFDATIVADEDMERGIKLAEYYLLEALRLSQRTKVSDEILLAEKTRVWLRDSWDYEDVTPAEIQQSGPTAGRTKAKVKKTIQELVEHGWLAELPPHSLVRGSPRKEAYKIVRVD